MDRIPAQRRRGDVTVGAAPTLSTISASTAVEQAHASRAPSRRPAMLSAWSELLEALPVAVLWIDRRGTVRQRNSQAQRLLGGELLGESWRKLVAQRFCTGATDARLTLADGTPVAVTINPYEEGQLVVVTPYGVTQTLLDIEARHTRLAEIGKLAAGLAHQLRTPIAAAQVYLDLARDTGNPEYFEQTQVALDSLTRHTESLLTLARGEIQRDANISTAELLEFITRQAHALLSRNPLEVSNSWPEARLQCNHHLLAGVVLNLIENAVQASPQGAPIELRCYRISADDRADRVEIVVRDSGCGIASPLSAQLGEPLITARPDGTGLGLAMARLITERHGGSLRIDSQPGRGTAVFLQFSVREALI